MHCSKPPYGCELGGSVHIHGPKKTCGGCVVRHFPFVLQALMSWKAAVVAGHKKRAAGTHWTLTLRRSVLRAWRARIVKMKVRGAKLAGGSPVTLMQGSWRGNTAAAMWIMGS